MRAIQLVSSIYLQYIRIAWDRVSFSFGSFLCVCALFFLCSYCSAIRFGRSIKQNRCMCTNAQSMKFQFRFYEVCGFVNIYCIFLTFANDPISIRMPVIDKQNRNPFVVPFSPGILCALFLSIHNTHSTYAIRYCWLIAHVKYKVYCFTSLIHCTLQVHTSEIHIK